ncbi:tRNA (adenine(22)-N(1))-methyltransferase TrmK [Clostridium sp. D2Q-11]|uniref:tRNA (Adenine(22)-N(1))-methyltransferase TrmK n=1 Tax=Anaeromonas frigoriresistens TaxID=2683708 RepID=A0A942Z7I9_9FIRM|nr:class I SAM-dependent methyltransferase [Anaeromonas frigoriresistens]MBS4536919.1 tRNA (adenine(22)-N(1))-methyltransferase TrmK [Anaeromonas frigoriresistens]
MKLTPRLLEIANKVEKDSVVADIGTDHGYIPVYLIEEGISRKVIACDINEGPLESAINYVTKKKYQDYIDTRLGDGLKPVKPNEVDTVIIAGMGGILIADILDADKKIADTIENFILQPMVASSELRKYLYNNGYKIVSEKLSREDNRFYEIIVATHGRENIEDEIYYEVGAKLIENKDPLLKDYLLKKIDKTQKIMKNIEEHGETEDNDKYNKLKERLSKLEEVYHDNF